jgi:hypothetical protein
MIPNPQALTLRWTGIAGDGETALDLPFLEGLHVTSAGSDPQPSSTASGR